MGMALAELLLDFNSDDPDIVVVALDKFVQQIRSEYSVTVSNGVEIVVSEAEEWSDFVRRRVSGWNGYKLNKKSKKTTLTQYVAESPFMSELFSLWENPARTSYPKLTLTLVDTFALILTVLAGSEPANAAARRLVRGGQGSGLTESLDEAQVAQPFTTMYRLLSGSGVDTSAAVLRLLRALAIQSDISLRDFIKKFDWKHKAFTRLCVRAQREAESKQKVHSQILLGVLKKRNRGSVIAVEDDEIELKNVMEPDEKANAKLGEAGKDLFGECGAAEFGEEENMDSKMNEDSVLHSIDLRYLLARFLCVFVCPLSPVDVVVDFLELKNVVLNLIRPLPSDSAATGAYILRAIEYRFLGLPTSYCHGMSFAKSESSQTAGALSVNEKEISASFYPLSPRKRLDLFIKYNILESIRRLYERCESRRKLREEVERNYNKHAQKFSSWLAREVDLAMVCMDALERCCWHSQTVLVQPSDISSGAVRNHKLDSGHRLLLRFARSLSPTTDEKQKCLLLELFDRYPLLIVPYVEQWSGSMEPRLEDAWFASVHFFRDLLGSTAMRRVTSLWLQSNLCRSGGQVDFVDDVVETSERSAATCTTNKLVDAESREGQRPLVSLVDILLPDFLSKKELSRGIQHPQVSVLTASLTYLATILQTTSFAMDDASRQIFEEDVSALSPQRGNVASHKRIEKWQAAISEVSIALRNKLPEIQTIIQVHSKATHSLTQPNIIHSVIGKDGGGLNAADSEETEFGFKNGDEAFDDQKAVFLRAISVLTYYLRLFPLAMVESRLDLAKVTPSAGEWLIFTVPEAYEILAFLFAMATKQPKRLLAAGSLKGHLAGYSCMGLGNERSGFGSLLQLYAVLTVIEALDEGERHLKVNDLLMRRSKLRVVRRRKDMTVRSSVRRLQNILSLAVEDAGIFKGEELKYCLEEIQIIVRDTQRDMVKGRDDDKGGHQKYWRDVDAQCEEPDALAQRRSPLASFLQCLELVVLVPSIDILPFLEFSMSCREALSLAPENEHQNSGLHSYHGAEGDCSRTCAAPGLCSLMLFVSGHLTSFRASQKEDGDEDTNADHQQRPHDESKVRECVKLRPQISAVRPRRGKLFEDLAGLRASAFEEISKEGLLSTKSNARTPSLGKLLSTFLQGVTLRYFSSVGDSTAFFECLTVLATSPLVLDGGADLLASLHKAFSPLLDAVSREIDVVKSSELLMKASVNSSCGSVGSSKSAEASTRAFESKIGPRKEASASDSTGVETEREVFTTELISCVVTTLKNAETRGIDENIARGGELRKDVENALALPLLTLIHKLGLCFAGLLKQEWAEKEERVLTRVFCCQDDMSLFMGFAKGVIFEKMLKERKNETIDPFSAFKLCGKVLHSLLAEYKTILLQSKRQSPELFRQGDQGDCSVPGDHAEALMEEVATLLLSVCEALLFASEDPKEEFGVVQCRDRMMVHLLKTQSFLAEWLLSSDLCGKHGSRVGHVVSEELLHLIVCYDRLRCWTSGISEVRWGDNESIWRNMNSESEGVSGTVLSKMVRAVYILTARIKELLKMDSSDRVFRGDEYGFGSEEFAILKREMKILCYAITHIIPKMVDVDMFTMPDGATRSTKSKRGVGSLAELRKAWMELTLVVSTLRTLAAGGAGGGEKHHSSEEVRSLMRMATQSLDLLFRPRNGLRSDMGGKALSRRERSRDKTVSERSATCFHFTNPLLEFEDRLEEGKGVYIFYSRSDRKKSIMTCECLDMEDLGFSRQSSADLPPSGKGKQLRDGGGAFSQLNQETDDEILLRLKDIVKLTLLNPDESILYRVALRIIFMCDGEERTNSSTRLVMTQERKLNPRRPIHWSSLIPETFFSLCWEKLLEGAHSLAATSGACERTEDPRTAAAGDWGYQGEKEILERLVLILVESSPLFLDLARFEITLLGFWDGFAVDTKEHSPEGYCKGPKNLGSAEQKQVFLQLLPIINAIAYASYGGVGALSARKSTVGDLPGGKESETMWLLCQISRIGSNDESGSSTKIRDLSQLSLHGEGLCSISKWAYDFLVTWMFSSSPGGLYTAEMDDAKAGRNVDAVPFAGFLDRRQVATELIALEVRKGALAQDHAQLLQLILKILELEGHEVPQKPRADSATNARAGRAGMKPRVVEQSVSWDKHQLSLLEKLLTQLIDASDPGEIFEDVELPRLKTSSEESRPAVLELLQTKVYLLTAAIVRVMQQLTRLLREVRNTNEHKELKANMHQGLESIVDASSHQGAEGHHQNHLRERLCYLTLILLDRLDSIFRTAGWPNIEQKASNFYPASEMMELGDGSTFLPLRTVQRLLALTVKDFLFTSLKLALSRPEVILVLARVAELVYTKKGQTHCALASTEKSTVSEKPETDMWMRLQKVAKLPEPGLLFQKIIGHSQFLNVLMQPSQDRLNVPHGKEKGVPSQGPRQGSVSVGPQNPTVVSVLVEADSTGADADQSWAESRRADLAAFAVVNLLCKLVRSTKDRSEVASKSLMPLLLSAYGGSCSAFDQRLWCLIEDIASALYTEGRATLPSSAKSKRRVIHLMGFASGTMAVDVVKKTLDNRRDYPPPSFEEIFFSWVTDHQAGGLSPDRLRASIESFPLSWTPGGVRSSSINFEREKEDTTMAKSEELAWIEDMVDTKAVIHTYKSTESSTTSEPATEASNRKSHSRALKEHVDAIWKEESVQSNREFHSRKLRQRDVEMAKVYDPQYIYAFLDCSLSFPGVPSRRWAEMGLLSYCIMGLAAQDEAARAKAYKLVAKWLRLFELAENKTKRRINDLRVTAQGSGGHRTGDESMELEKYAEVDNIPSSGDNAGEDKMTVGKATGAGGDPRAIEEMMRDFKERPQLLLLLRALQNGITSECQRIPTIVAVFLSESVKILFHPRDPLYANVNKFLLQRPSLDLRDVPMFYSLFFSGNFQNYRHERSWIIRVLEKGIKSRKYWTREVELVERREEMNDDHMDLEATENGDDGDDSRKISQSAAVEDPCVKEDTVRKSARWDVLAGLEADGLSARDTESNGQFDSEDEEEASAPSDAGEEDEVEDVEDHSEGELEVSEEEEDSLESSSRIEMSVLRRRHTLPLISSYIQSFAVTDGSGSFLSALSLWKSLAHVKTETLRYEASFLAWFSEFVGSLGSVGHKTVGRNLSAIVDITVDILEDVFIQERTAFFEDLPTTLLTQQRIFAAELLRSGMRLVQKISDFGILVSFANIARKIVLDQLMYNHMTKSGPDLVKNTAKRFLDENLLYSLHRKIGKCEEILQCRRHPRALLGSKRSESRSQFSHADTIEHCEKLREILFDLIILNGHDRVDDSGANPRRERLPTWEDPAGRRWKVAFLIETCHRMDSGYFSSCTRYGVRHSWKSWAKFLCWLRGEALFDSVQKRWSRSEWSNIKVLESGVPVALTLSDIIGGTGNELLEHSKYLIFAQGVLFQALCRPDTSGTGAFATLRSLNEILLGLAFVEVRGMSDRVGGETETVSRWKEPALVMEVLQTMIKELLDYSLLREALVENAQGSKEALFHQKGVDRSAESYQTTSWNAGFVEVTTLWIRDLMVWLDEVGGEGFRRDHQPEDISKMKQVCAWRDLIWGRIDKKVTKKAESEEQTAANKIWAERQGGRRRRGRSGFDMNSEKTPPRSKKARQR